ncbi:MULTISPECIES: hypothetical protein [unclassified Prosthecochloris]|uniref:hypothetical protein n=1 Tax=unclassified Prosthecochloris TaxID=2632826 RepID=UPI00223DDC6C|nr:MULTISPECIES: hypothetical protein [unclassified Prosthecochloris]UZJ37656.1 hypothetical protein OO005_00135 [Prosthecochloris sp. SCSIO W1103]UZJ39474.1 hypothetical protein OO185_05960 [Prosthecochloris sp. SCSIO W1102]
MGATNQEKEVLLSRLVEIDDEIGNLERELDEAKTIETNPAEKDKAHDVIEKEVLNKENEKLRIQVLVGQEQTREDLTKARELAGSKSLKTESEAILQNAKLTTRGGCGGGVCLTGCTTCYMCVKEQLVGNVPLL